MKLLIHMSLSDNKVRDKLLPLARIKEVERIDVVRYNEGPPIDKVRYIYPQKKSRFLMYFERIRLLRKCLRQNRYDYAIAYMFFPHGIVTLNAAKKTGTPTILSLIAGPIELLSFFHANEQMRYTDALPRKRFSNRLIMFYIRQFHKVTVTGSFTQSVLLKSGMTSSKVAILRNIVDEQRFCPAPTEKSFDVLILSFFSRIKNIKTAIAAIGRVAKNLHNITVACVGHGPEMAHLRSLVQKLHLENNITFCEPTTSPQDFFRRSRIFLLCSLREGFPSTIVESLACGTPVICSACGDVIDLVRNGWNGLLIDDAENDAAYAEALLKILQDPVFEKKLAANTRSIVDQCSVKAATDAWRSILMPSHIKEQQ